MTYKIKLTLILVCIFLSSAVQSSVEAKSNVKLIGSIAGYNIWRGPTVSFLNVESILLLKVSKVIKGKVKSDYVIVRFFATPEDYSNRGKNVGVTKDYSLERRSDCDDTITNLLTFEIRNAQGEITDSYESLILSSDTNKEALPLTKKLPCYNLLYNEN